VTLPCAAESIRIDAAPEHATNTIRPTEALGAGGRPVCPYGAGDKLLKEGHYPTRFWRLGGRTVTYRQNTELHTEALHWNPRGDLEASRAARGFTFVG